MMSADDEPQLQTSKSQNSLITEAFNLNTNFASIQPLTVLPPTTNHFKPIGTPLGHSRTPSAEVNSLNLTALKPPPANPFMNTAAKTPNSFFDQPNITPTILAPPLKLATPEPKNSCSEQTVNSQYKAPASMAPTSSLSQPPVLNPMPPSSVQMSTVQPPTALPPPPASSTSSGSSNPYAAKGALNKKVQHNVINVAPITQPATFLSAAPSTIGQSGPMLLPPAPESTSLNQPNSLFMPPPPPTQPQQQIMSPPQSLHTSQSFNQFPNSPLQSTPGLAASQSVNNMQDNQHYNDYNNYNNYNNNNSNNNDSGQSYYSNGQNTNNQNGSKWNFSWLAQNKLVNTFVEKAKISVESFVNTVDPQMSNYNHPANRPLYLLSSTSTAKVVHTLREAFNNCGFSKISINAIDAQNSSQFAPQIIGYPSALQSVKEKLEHSLAIMQDAECTIVAVQDFIAELTTDCWFELAVVMLKDKRKNIELTVYTEALPVSTEEIGQLEQYTPKDYHLKWSGLSCRLPEKNFNFNAVQSNCSSPFLNYETADTMVSNERLSHAFKVLATLFKNRMLAQM